ncbi:hypothetical protein [Nocardia sp. NPDC049526]|uniref:Vgb family protein n=1 Tax=Nocardia sp. NPDC049526 TaxID=3364316 RepID=UPI003798349E
MTPLPCAIQAASDGKVYFANGVRNQIGSIDPSTKKIELYQSPSPAGNLNPFNDITVGPDQAIWFTQTSAAAIGRFDLTTKTFTDIPIPTPAAFPVGIFAASDGGVWFTEALGGKIGRIDIPTRHVSEYPIPTPAGTPFVVRAETAGRYVWFTEIAAGKVGRIDLATKQIVEYPMPTPASTPTAVCASAAGYIYVSHATTDTLSKLDPRTGQVVEIPLPDSVGSVPGELNCGPGNAVWLVQVTANRVLRYSLD